MAQVNGAESLVQSLVAHGVDTVFGLPGVQIMPIFDALHGHPEIRVVNVRHEQAAAYMADGYARTSGSRASRWWCPAPAPSTPREPWAPPTPHRRPCSSSPDRSARATWDAAAASSTRSTTSLRSSGRSPSGATG